MDAGSVKACPEAAGAAPFSLTNAERSCAGASGAGAVCGFSSFGIAVSCETAGGRSTAASSPKIAAISRSSPVSRKPNWSLDSLMNSAPFLIGTRKDCDLPLGDHSLPGPLILMYSWSALRSAGGT